MTPSPVNATAPDIHIASLVADLDSNATRLFDVVSRLIEQFNTLGVRFKFDSPIPSNPAIPASALDGIYLSTRMVQSSVDRLDQIERTLRDSLAKNTPPDMTSPGPGHLGGRYA